MISAVQINLSATDEFVGGCGGWGGRGRGIELESTGH